MELSVVIPVYGCPAALPELYRRLTETLSRMTGEYEIILVNDGCPKNSWEGIRKLCEADSRVVGIELSRNFGQLKATLAGLDASRGKWVVVMDCDLQDRPEEIPALYEKAQEGYDYVVARRENRKDSRMKVWVSRAFYSVYSFATGVKYDPALANFSICSRQVIDQYCRMREQHRAFTMYLLWMGYKWTTVDVRHEERYEGKSGYDLRKRTRMAFELLTSQSDKLLRVMTGTGFAIAVLAMIYMIWIVIRQLVSPSTVAGYSSTIAVILLMGGLMILSIGLVGLYIGNIFMEVKRRPLYIVRSVLNGSGKTEKDE